MYYNLNISLILKNINKYIIFNDIIKWYILYKDRIINGDKIVEENYKNFNKYRNKENNKLNLKKLNGHKIQIRNIGLNIFKKREIVYINHWVMIMFSKNLFIYLKIWIII